MPRKVEVNPRQELFLRHYLRTWDRRLSYRLAYPKCTSDKAARVNAHQMLNRRPVKRRFKQLQEQMMKRSDITAEKILTDYQEALNLAKSQEKASEIVQAATAQAKLVGLIKDKTEIGGVGDFDNLDNPSEIIEKLAAQIGDDKALAVARALGIVQDSSKVQKAQEAELLNQDPVTEAIN